MLGPYGGYPNRPVRSSRSVGAVMSSHEFQLAISRYCRPNWSGPARWLPPRQAETRTARAQVGKLRRRRRAGALCDVHSLLAERFPLFHAVFC